LALLQRLPKRPVAARAERPPSQATWDVIRSGYGPEDVLLIDRALEQTFGRGNVDPRRL